MRYRTFGPSGLRVSEAFLLDLPMTRYGPDRAT